MAKISFIIKASFYVSLFYHILPALKSLFKDFHRIFISSFIVRSPSLFELRITIIKNIGIPVKYR
ncbi:hypothetical protein HOLDEFILI_01313 [Holdemania filiformis DSM 12042]|uniref:Uncharacterized protein n=1 Tax=Holdemania filiformis DSM 12042 TaxID=545696 RepID=B9Y680_9FIRM|nr:hypothetical protein HOLDEFILI_01313 [Holdemania filiformis DSM 12042]